jgi:hypothetical protein
MAEWVSIEEKGLPCNYQHILFLEPYGEKVGGDVFIGYRDGDSWVDENGEVNNGYISHYIIIPNTAEIVDELDKKHGAS